jgi:hypothetical protein
MTTVSSNTSATLREIRRTIPVFQMKYIKVPVELESLALRVGQAFDKTKALRGQQTLERGFHHHLMKLFLEIDGYQSLWQASSLVGMKYKLEQFINETSLYLQQTDLNRFGTNMHKYKHTLR